ncbi:MAG: hypothetical protein KGI08_11095 [Thaumarchaeota archaeon]|nr:hypothetical protein [Nitrososphaerota archaeon]
MSVDDNSVMGVGFKPDDKSYRNMSAREREVRICFLLVRDDRKCSTRFGYGCGKSIEQLLLEAEDKADRTGVERKLPVVYIDHVDGDSNWNDDPADPNGKGYCANNELLCASCNRRKPTKILSVSNLEGMSREKRDSIQIHVKFVNKLQDYLSINEHICYAEMLNVGPNWAGCNSQITIQRHFEMDKVSKPQPEGLWRVFHYECGSSDCDGDHVCLRGDLPKVIIDEKRREFEELWKRDYGWNTREEYGNRPMNQLYKEYVTLNDFVTKMLNNYFNKNS